MIKESSFREEILSVSHRWPYPMLAFLLGCLVGLGVSILFPDQYRAETRLTVAYNSDAIMRNPDDYKNWQMKQLDALAKTPDVLQETLSRLRSFHPYWNSVSIETLQESLHVSWRNTGIWRLSATNQEKDRAAEAVDIWSQVVEETYQDANSSAIEFMRLDKKLSELTELLAEATEETAQISSWYQELNDIEEYISKLPPDKLVDKETHIRLYSLAKYFAKSDSDLFIVTDELPSEGSSVQNYQEWITKMVVALEVNQRLLENQKEILEEEYSIVNDKYINALDNSQGLSSTLLVDRPFGGVWQTKVIRPTSVLMLVGGILGLLAWMLGWVVLFTLQND